MCLKLPEPAGLRLLIIDELHNILAGPTELQREFLGHGSSSWRRSIDRVRADASDDVA